MSLTNRWIVVIASVAIVMAGGAITVFGQLPIPVQGQRGGQTRPRRRSRGNQGSAVAAGDSSRHRRRIRRRSCPPIATASPEVTGPGKFFETLMELKPGDDLAHFGYVTKEYFVTGTANGQPYKTRIVIRRPSDNSKFSGLVLAESMHPSGNPWMFHFTHTYSMTEGHIGLEILTSATQGFTEFNAERYKDLSTANGQAGEIIAQVGALLKSKRADNPLAGLPIRKMVLAGSSASAAVVVNYLPTHMVQRLADMSPIYDGFMPTSNGANLRMIDVPMIQVPTMREVFQGNGPTRQDGDAPGNQFRIYEFAGMAHIDSRDAVAYYPDPCKLPISRFPLAAYMSVALNHLWHWVDKGTVPPHADRFYVDFNTDSDGSLLALDECRQREGRDPEPVRGRARPRSSACPTRAPSRRSRTRIRSSRRVERPRRTSLCGLANYQINFTPRAS